MAEPRAPNPCARQRHWSKLKNLHLHVFKEPGNEGKHPGLDNEVQDKASFSDAGPHHGRGRGQNPPAINQASIHSAPGLSNVRNE